MREIAEHKIKIYEFPETDDEEENRLVKKIKVLTPGDSQHSEVPHCVRHNNTIITHLPVKASRCPLNRYFSPVVAASC